MTHLSDYSFLQRAIGLSYIFIWLLYRVHTTGGLSCLSFSRVKRGELKSIVTFLILIMIPFQLYYDIASCRIKYEEGFVQVNNATIVTKPEFLWSKEDKDLVIPTDYSLCIGFSLQTGTLLLLQCFWKYLAKLVAKARFMSSKEFKFYIAWTIINIIMFPVIQYNFSRDIYDYTYKEIMPQLIYGCELFIIAMLGVVSHFRFKKLLSNSQTKNDFQFITHKIQYFQDLNLLLTITLFVFSSSFIILSADGLTQKKVLNIHKFTSDFFICNINIISIIVWMIVILIFHPKKLEERSAIVPYNAKFHSGMDDERSVEDDNKSTRSLN